MVTIKKQKWNYQQTAMNAAQVRSIQTHLKRTAAAAKNGGWKL